MSFNSDMRRVQVFWFTGFPGSGKTTLAKAFAHRIKMHSQPVIILDGDSVRQGLNSDLGFSSDARTENIRRVAEVAKLLSENGIVVIAALITPLATDRQLAKSIVGYEIFVEVFVDAPLDICEARDPKGMYREARNGNRANFTGLTAPYSAPLNPSIHLRTNHRSISSCVEELMCSWIVLKNL
jgi:adenylylsulfate kinase